MGEDDTNYGENNSFTVSKRNYQYSIIFIWSYMS